MPKNVKDWIQAISWLVASIGGVVVAFKAVAEMRRSRIDRRRDFRWRQARMSKDLFDELFGDNSARSALRMLDWDGAAFEVGDGTIKPISRQLMLSALRTTNTEFNPTEQFVRHCFDRLFDWMERVEQFRGIELVSFADFEHGMSYYVALLSAHKDVFSNYLDTYGFADANKLLLLFPSWQ
jgi:hypothetical protein